nr:hypothetical protein Itr_chr13CG14660 [Ipomoea trifida]GLL44783.1 hypothetical protein Itr_chr13CG14670 [Ipomoea trifida]
MRIDGDIGNGGRRQQQSTSTTLISSSTFKASRRQPLLRSPSSRVSSAAVSSSGVVGDVDNEKGEQLDVTLTVSNPSDREKGDDGFSRRRQNRVQW